MNKEEIEEVRQYAIHKRKLHGSLTLKERAQNDAKYYKELMKGANTTRYVTKEMTQKNKKLLGLK